MKVVNHRQSKTGFIADVRKLSSVYASAESRVDIRLTDAGHTRVFVEKSRQRVVHTEKI